MTEAWVDGAFRDKSCGWAFAVLEDGEFIFEDCGSDVPYEYLTHRNVAGEIYAVLKLIDFCRENEIAEIYIYHDYVGLQAWAEGNFKTNTPLTKYYKECIQKSGISVRWHKLESHTGDTWNEYADKLAKFAIGIISEHPKMPDCEEKPPIDINSIKRVNLRELMEKQKAAEIPQPVQDIPQMAYSTPSEEKNASSLTVIQAFERAEALAKDERWREAYDTLKPFMSNTLSDEQIAYYLFCMTKCSGSLAAKAAETAKKCLRLRHGSKPIQREYCRALYWGLIVPALVSLNLNEKEYTAGREACEALLSVSSGSPMIIDMILPFMRVAYRAGDRELLSKIKAMVNPNIISAESIRIGSVSISKRQEFIALTKI